MPGTLLASMLMLLCRTMRDLAMVVSREEDADDGIMEPVPDLRPAAVLAGVEGAEVTTGTSGFVGSSLVKVPWRMSSGSGVGATFAFAPPIAPSDGCRSRILGMSVLLLVVVVLLLLTEEPVPVSSSEFRFDPMLERALSGCGLARLVSTSELWLRSFGVANGSFFVAGTGAAGVRAMTAGADTTVLRYGDTYAGFFVPRTVFTA